MTRNDLKQHLIAAILEIAPDADMDDLGRDGNIRDDLDLDSIDFLNIVVALHDRVGVDIPESDYPALETLDGFTNYLAQKCL